MHALSLNPVTPLLGICPTQSLHGDAVEWCQWPVWSGHAGQDGEMVDAVTALLPRTDGPARLVALCVQPQGCCRVLAPPSLCPHSCGVPAALWDAPGSTCVPSLGRALACPFVGHAKAIFCLSTVPPFKLQDTCTGKTVALLAIPHTPRRVPRSLQAPGGGALPVSRHPAEHSRRCRVPHRLSGREN